MTKFTSIVVLAMALMGAGVSQANCIHPDDAEFVSANGGCHDTDSGLTWSRSISRAAGGSRNYTTAVAYCLALTEGGFTDWELPFIDELLSLTQKQHFLGVNYQDVILPYASYWSVDLTKKKGSSAWGVTGLFATVETAYDAKKASIDAICVR